MSGVPIPEVKWSHNGHPIAEGSEVKIDSGPTYSTLTISPSKKENAGQYRVAAENSVGSDEVDFDVDIKGWCDQDALFFC